MDKQFKKCAVSPIDLINPSMYHEITKEILRKYSFSGTVEKITEDYWKAYITVFNRLIGKCEEVMNK